MKDGNLTYDGTYKYTYDHQNRLVKATRADTDVVIQTASFDGLGRRIKKIVTNSGDLDAATVYHHDGNQIIETRDGSNNVTMQVYHGTQYIDEVVGMRLEHGRVYVHQAEGDQSGSLKDWNVTCLTDLTGRLLERNYYSPYGQPEITVDTHFFDYDDDGDVDEVDVAAGTSTGVCWGSYSGDCKRLDADADRDIDAADYAVIAAFADALSSDAEIQRVPAANASRFGSPFTHQGFLLDAEIAGYQARHRWYAARHKGFSQRDPAGALAGLNLYEQLRCNPIRWQDPLGLLPMDGLPCCLCCACGEKHAMIALVGVLDAETCGDLAADAGTATGTTGLTDEHQRNAFLHCYGQCIATLELGASTAQKCGDVHESCGRAKGQSFGEEEKDQHNNALGRSVADRTGATTSTCYDDCYNAVVEAGTDSCPPANPPAATDAQTCVDPAADPPPNPTLPMTGCD